jgi:hypothetical protein
MFYFNGDSFVYGLELEDINNRFSTLVSKHYNKKELNDSIRGASNQRIFRTTMEAIASFPDIQSIVIMWTDPNRFEHFLGPNIFSADDDGWRRITTYRLKPDNFLPSERDTFIKNFHHPDVRTINKSLLEYSVHVRTETHVINELLNQILQLQLVCTLKNINCKMSYSYISDILDNQNVKTYIKNHNLYNKIDWTTKYWLDEDTFWSMNTFCKEQNIDFGPSLHPLESGHRLVANKIIDVFKKDK